MMMLSLSVIRIVGSTVVSTVVSVVAGDAFAIIVAIVVECC